jgi:hypothetical protein
MTPSFEEAKSMRELINKCKLYFNENFHKFSETNKIKVGLAILTKSMPTQVEGELKGDGTKVVIIKEIIGNKSEAGRLSGSLSIIKE